MAAWTGAGDERRAIVGHALGCKHAARGLDHRHDRLAGLAPDECHLFRVLNPGDDDQVRVAMRDRDQIRAVPFGTDAVDPDRNRHRPFAPYRLDRSLARAVLVLRLHSILKVEHDEVGPRFSSFLNRPRIGRGQEQHRPYAEKVQAHVRFRFPAPRRRRIIALV